MKEICFFSGGNNVVIASGMMVDPIFLLIIIQVMDFVHTVVLIWNAPM